MNYSCLRRSPKCCPSCNHERHEYLRHLCPCSCHAHKCEPWCDPEPTLFNQEAP